MGAAEGASASEIEGLVQPEGDRHTESLLKLSKVLSFGRSRPLRVPILRASRLVFGLFGKLQALFLTSRKHSQEKLHIYDLRFAPDVVFPIRNGVAGFPVPLELYYY